MLQRHIFSRITRYSTAASQIRHLHTQHGGAGAWRSPGHPPGCWGLAGASNQEPELALARCRAGVPPNWVAGADSAASITASLLSSLHTWCHWTVKTMLHMTRKEDRADKCVWERCVMHVCIKGFYRMVSCCESFLPESCKSPQV